MSVTSHPDTASWVPHARTVLLKAAEEYGAVIGDRYLRNLVEHTAGAVEMPPATTLVGALADQCLASNESILPALCAQPDGRVHSGYAAWIRDSLGGSTSPRASCTPTGKDSGAMHISAPTRHLRGAPSSIECPLGRALNGARVGETRRYETKSGRFMSITVLAVDSVNPKATTAR